MFIVGEGSIAAKRLCQITYEAMWHGIVKVRPGVRLGDIGHAIQVFAENSGYSVVREFCGHGIGSKFHEEPQVLHYGRPGTLEELVPGMIFTIEPMINAGRREIKETGDGWTIVTKGPFALRAVGAHRARHRDRLRGADRLRGQHAAAGVRQGAGAQPASRPPGQRGAGERGLKPAGEEDPVRPPRPPTRRRPRRRPARLRRAPSVAELRERFRTGKAALLEHFRDSRPTAPAATRLLRALVRHVDQALADLWLHAGMPPGAVLVAVGGYGRGELFPYSDVDVLVLLPEAAAHGHPAVRTAVEAFITTCWDIGIEIGSSVRTIEECLAEARADVTVQTALLESRLLCGSRRLFNRVRRVNAEAMDRARLPARQGVRDAAAPLQVRGRRLLARAQLQGEPGRPARPAALIWIARAAGLGRTWPSSPPRAC
jgi:hypothetical protein